MIKKRTLMLVGFLIASIVFIECDTKSTQKEAITPTEQVTEKTDYKEIYNHLIAEYKPEIISEEEFDNFKSKSNYIEAIKAYDLKNFIYRRTNEKLQELGLDPVFEYDEKSADALDWFYHLTGGHTHTDFFAIRPTDYAKAGEGDDWDDIW